MSSGKFPPALPHGELTEVLPNLFFVCGTLAMGGPMRFSRNMTVIRAGERLVIVNSVRLDEAGLRALDALGKVTDVIRIAGFHGMDDPFYKDRYGAQVWCVNGQRYTTGFDTKSPKTYFTADQLIDANTALPVEGMRIHIFGSDPPEALLSLEQNGGVLISGDCLQNWQKPDAYFSFIGGVLMRVMGFIKPHNVGPGWLKNAKPPLAEVRALLDRSFENVLPAHGDPVIGGAKERFRPAIERATR